MLPDTKEQSSNPTVELYTKFNGGAFLVDLKIVKKKNQLNLQPLLSSQDLQRNSVNKRAFLDRTSVSFCGLEEKSIMI